LGRPPIEGGNTALKKRSFIMIAFAHGFFHRTRPARPLSSPAETNLAEVVPGSQATFLGFAPGMPAERQAHLQAYGLVPGSLVQVVQHSPVTVVQVDHLELALERSLARLVLCRR
jgi:Fe2+ transport system protein FeoA